MMMDEAGGNGRVKLLLLFFFGLVNLIHLFLFLHHIRDAEGGGNLRSARGLVLTKSRSISERGTS